MTSSISDDRELDMQRGRAFLVEKLLHWEISRKF